MDVPMKSVFPEVLADFAERIIVVGSDMELNTSHHGV
jgi:hypothetical protein